MTRPVVAHTGPGPMPGTDPREAARVVLGECPALPFLPELPERGPGADAVGRTAALLADLPVDVSTRGWRLAGTAGAEGRPARRAADLLDRDADALEEADELARGVTVDRDLVRGGATSSSSPAGPASGRLLQVRVRGPWSLAAALELPGGLPVLTDRGARRDVAESLAEGAAAYAVRLAGLLGARARVLLDEPLLWHVATGAVAGPSRYDPIPAVPADRLSLSLCRFGDALRAGGVAEVFLRAPGGARGAPSDQATPFGDGPPVCWQVIAEPPRGETPLDGLCLPAAALALPSGLTAEGADRDDEHAEAVRARVHAALDAAGTVLGDGRTLQLEGLPGRDGLPREAAGVEAAAVGVLDLLDRLAAPRYATLDRIVLSPTAAQVTGAAGGAASALAAVRRVADAAPVLAE